MTCCGAPFHVAGAGRGGGPGGGRGGGRGRGRSLPEVGEPDVRRLLEVRLPVKLRLLTVVHPAFHAGFVRCRPLDTTGRMRCSKPAACPKSRGSGVWF